MCALLSANTFAQAPQTIKQDFIARISKLDTSYEYINNSAKLYFANAGTSTDSILRKDANAYRRWNYFWGNRVQSVNNTTGSFTKANQVMQAYTTANASVCNTATFPGSWLRQGPAFPNPATAKQVMGIIVSVWANPANPGHILAGSNTGGLWKTINNGTNWTCLTDAQRYPNMGISAIAVDPNNINTIYISTGGTSNYSFYSVGVLKSTNGGATWASTALSTANNSYFDKIIIDPNNPLIVYAAGGNKIFKTTDGGVTWPVIYTLPAQPASCTPANTSYYEYFSDIEFNPTNSNIIYASTTFGGTGCGARMVSSINGGSTWLAATPGLYSERIAIAVTPADPTAVYAQYRATNTFIKKSVDNGATWATINANVTGLTSVGYYKNQFEINKLNANIMYSGDITMFKSTNGGVSFVSTSSYSPSPGVNSTHGDIRATCISSASATGTTDVVVMGTDGGVSKTINGATNWVNMNGTDLIITQFYGIDNSNITKTDLILGGTQDNNNFKLDGGNWTNYLGYNQLGGDGYRAIIDYSNSNNMYIQCNQSIYKSTDAGVNWTDIGAPANEWASGRPFFQDPTNPAIIYSLRSNGIYKYSGTGTTWTALTGNLPAAALNNTFFAAAIAPSNPLVMYVASSSPTWGNTLVNKVFKTIDGGTTWTDISAGASALSWTGATALVVDPKDPNKFWMGFNGYWDWPVGSTTGVNRVMQCNNGTWTDFSTGLPPFPVSTLVYQRGSVNGLYCGNDVGVFHYNNATATWECFNSGLPVIPVTDLKINYCKGTIDAATYGRGIFSSPLIPETTELIATNTTWAVGTVTNVTTDIIVKAGATLTIKGRVNIAQDKRIIVERGPSGTLAAGTLVVDGGVLTNDCGDLWGGVEVWGDKTQAQAGGTGYKQGKVILQNNARIENAKLAIVTAKRLTGNTWDVNYAGGIVQCTNSTIANCINGAYFYPYKIGTVNNLSTFNNCVFETNKNLNSGLPQFHLTFNGIQGINVIGCDFKNTVTPAPTIVTQLGSGISSSDSRYAITRTCIGASPCTTYDVCNFTNLEYGVYTANTNIANGPKIEYANFNGYKNVKISNSNVSSLTFNTFNVKDDATSGNIDYGVLLEATPLFTCEENTFSTTTNAEYGLWVKDEYVVTSPTTNPPTTTVFCTTATFVYKNTFNGFNKTIVPLPNPVYGAACYSTGNNANPQDPGTGVRYYCNDYGASTSNISDINTTLPVGAGLVDKYTSQFNGMGVGHGTSVTAPLASQNLALIARNRFYTNAQANATSKGIIHDALAPDVYYQYNSNVANTNPSASSIKIVKTNITNGTFNYATQCVTNFPACGIGCRRLPIIAGLNTQINALSTQLNVANTATWQTMLANGETAKVYAQVLNAAPYVLDNIVLQLTQAPTLTTQEVKQLLAKCGAASPMLMTVISNNNPALAKDIEYSLLNTNAQQNALALKAELANKQEQVLMHTNALLTEYAHNEEHTAYGMDSIQAYYKNNNTVAGMYFNYQLQNETGKHKNTQLLTQLSQAGLSNYVSYETLVAQLKATPLQEYSLLQDKATTEQMLAFANSNYSLEAVHARGLLHKVFGTTWPDVVNGGTNQSDTPTTTEALSTNNSLQAYPNPSANFVTFTYTALSKTDNELHIAALDGRVLKTIALKADRATEIVDFSNLQAGTYIVYLKTNNVTKASCQVIIIK